jgi:molecular chaperone HscB
MVPSEKLTNPDNDAFVIHQEKPATENCWSCGAMRAAHFCHECGKVQPPTPVDYFAFFGLPYKLNVDVSQLERDFYTLSRRLHPDINATGTGQEQEWSLEKSSQLNDAYRTLKDPITRTEYLLRLQGVQMEEQSKAATEEARRTGQLKKQVVPPDLLEQVFELNMQLEEMRMNKKMGELDRNLESELRDTRQQLQTKYQDLLQELRNAWDEWDAVGDAANELDPPRGLEDERAAARDKMVDVLNRRSYLRNLLRDVDEVLES